MFELSIAWKYLLPKKRQLSVSIISLISIIVISLVVWLILVFFSVTSGLEKGWVEKLITLTAPIRITPTDAYYQSYYYQIDHYSSASDYNFRSISEKKEALLSDPYNEEEDEELPLSFPKNEQKDLVKLAFDAIQAIPGLTAHDYEVTSANLRLRLLRGLKNPLETTQSFLSQAIFLGTFEKGNLSYQKIMAPFIEDDLNNTLDLVKLSAHGETEDVPSGLKNLNASVGKAREKQLVAEIGTSLDKINALRQESNALTPFYAYYRENNGYKLPYDQIAGFGVLAPKAFRDAGVLLGDRGFISYYAPTASTVQEQRLPIFIAGFYDPGIVPLGGKFLLSDSSLVRTIRSSQAQDNVLLTNGINVRFDSFKDAEKFKKQLIHEFEKRGIDPFWKIETYRDFDYSKDLLQQLSSEKNIFGLIAAVIIIVACSNIISMLIILVNDKKTEIGILRSMGASSYSIALIFGLSGIIMGLVGTVIGSLFAFFTLRNLSSLLSFISRMQGFDAFNPVFYGDHLPNTMSYEVLFIVLGVTVVISLLAGLVPAVKASQMKPASILRAE